MAGNGREMRRIGGKMAVRCCGAMVCGEREWGIENGELRIFLGKTSHGWPKTIAGYK